MANSYSVETYLNQPSNDFSLERNGRDFKSLSIHPNGEDWFFTECSREFDLNGDCYVLQYSLKTKKLQRYDLPSNYLYGYANFSPQGRYIIMSRTPKHNGSKKEYQDAIEKSEITIMQSDGKNFTILPIANGNKILPIMSKNEMKISYWRSATLIPFRNTLISADFDVYEYDLENEKEELFSGPYNFFDPGNIQYFSENEILLSSYGPKKYIASSEYSRKFNGSQIYKIQKGRNDSLTPFFVEIANVKDPSIDRYGNIYLTGQPPRLGSSFVKITPNKDVIFWQANTNLALSGFREVITDPNGKYVAFVYVAEGKNYRDRKNSFGILYVNNGSWVPVYIPELNKSTLLKITKSSD